MSEEESEDENATIKIIARLRPLKSNKKIVSEKTSCFTIKENNRISIKIPKESGLTINNSKEDYDFKFNSILSMDVQQEESWDIIAKDVVDSVINGYNGTIFAYGQVCISCTFHRLAVEKLLQLLVVLIATKIAV